MTVEELGETNQSPPQNLNRSTLLDDQVPQESVFLHHDSLDRRRRTRLVPKCAVFGLRFIGFDPLATRETLPETRKKSSLLVRMIGISQQRDNLFRRFFCVVLRDSATASV